MAIVGKGSGGTMAVLFAALHPERVSSLVLINAWARLSWAPDFPLGIREVDQEAMLQTPYMPPASVDAVDGEPLARAAAVGCCGIIAAVAGHSLFENLHALNMGIQLAGVWALLTLLPRRAPVPGGAAPQPLPGAEQRRQ